MQKLISKYGLAAHLALLAVAPLIVFPYLELGDASKVVLWLSLLAFAWFVNAPSRINNERSTGQARRRVFAALMSDPMFWLWGVVTLIAGICALNNGIELEYDAENYIWFMSEPYLKFMPSSMGESGLPMFVSILLVWVVYSVSKHALGKSARGALGYLVGVLGGLAGILAVYQFVTENQLLKTLSECSITNPAFAGSGFGIALLVLTGSLATVFERRWAIALVTLPFAVSGLVAALFLFSPAYLALAYLLAAVLILSYMLFWGTKRLGKSSSLRALALFGIGLVLAAIFVYAAGFDLVMGRLTTLSKSVLSAAELEISSKLSAISMKVWHSNLWLGTGLGTFPHDLRFNATDEDWAVIAIAQATPINGWHYLLVERGIVGALFLAVPAAFLLWGYVARIISAAKELPSPMVLVGPLALIVSLGFTTFNTSLFRLESMALIVLAVALSTNAWVKEKKEDGK